MRRVIFIPTIHDPSVGHSVGMSPEVANAVSNYVKRYSSVVENILANKSFDPERTRVYLEATHEPVAAELPHIEKTAEAGSWECKLALDLLRKGMKYEPTELGSAHERQGRLMDSRDRVAYSKIRAIYARNERVKKQREALERKMNDQIDELDLVRNRETADRINQTLKDGETGIVIFGENHNIRPFLDPSIKFYSLKDEIAQEIKPFDADEAIKVARQTREGNFRPPETKS